MSGSGLIRLLAERLGAGSRRAARTPELREVLLSRMTQSSDVAPIAADSAQPGLTPSIIQQSDAVQPNAADDLAAQIGMSDAEAIALVRKARAGLTTDAEQAQMRDLMARDRASRDLAEWRGPLSPLRRLLSGDEGNATGAARTADLAPVETNIFPGSNSRATLRQIGQPSGNRPSVFAWGAEAEPFEITIGTDGRVRLTGDRLLDEGATSAADAREFYDHALAAIAHDARTVGRQQYSLATHDLMDARRVRRGDFYASVLRRAEQRGELPEGYVIDASGPEPRLVRSPRPTPSDATRGTAVKVYRGLDSAFSTEGRRGARAHEFWSPDEQTARSYATGEEASMVSGEFDPTGALTIDAGGAHYARGIERSRLPRDVDAEIDRIILDEDVPPGSVTAWKTRVPTDVVARAASNRGYPNVIFNNIRDDLHGTRPTTVIAIGDKNSRRLSPPSSDATRGGAWREQMDGHPAILAERMPREVARPSDELAALEAEGGRLTQVNLNDIVPTQTRIDRGVIEGMRQRPSDQPMQVYRVNGRLYLADGHHRFVSAIENGDRAVQVQLYDLDAAGMTPRPAQSDGSNALKALAIGLPAGGLSLRELLREQYT